tara:strand:+ start:202 stop:588 length:387 start_codon:yes stop_codon:yes gene_type:complete
MSWSAIKIFFEKGCAWCIQHWRWLIFGLVALIAYITGRKSSKNLWMKAELARKQYKAEAAAIERAHLVEKKKIKKAEKEFENRNKEIENKKIQDQKDLEVKKRREMIRIVNDQEAIDDALKNSGIGEV